MSARRKRTELWEEVEVINAPRKLWRDLYHRLIQASWSTSLGVVTVVFLATNLLFAIGYWLTGGVEGAHGFADLFFFSVETAATIGYGTLHPTTAGAHLVVTLEALVSILIVALTTGIVFTKFSVPRARVQFVEHPVVTLHDGVPTLQIRIGNERASRIIEATVRVVMLRTEKTREGMTIYRMHDLPLVRDRSPALSRSWLVLHHFDKKSPLHGATPETMARDEVEIVLTLTGTDEVSAQPQHAQRRWVAADVKWGMRHADMLSDHPSGNGQLQLDMARFHELVPTPATEEFPYGTPTA